MDKPRSFGRYSSLADYGYGVQFLVSLGGGLSHNLLYHYHHLVWAAKMPSHENYGRLPGCRHVLLCCPLAYSEGLQIV
jgi:hypothetical protein